MLFSKVKGSYEISYDSVIDLISGLNKSLIAARKGNLRNFLTDDEFDALFSFLVFLDFQMKIGGLSVFYDKFGLNDC